MPPPVELSIESITITGKPDSWEQPLGNITQDIIRYTPAGSPITVQLHRIMSQGNSVAELVIDDSGPGIPESMRECIFDRFARLDDSRSTETGGFGLGMSIIKAKVTAHSGFISTQESPTGGLRIRIWVPVSQAPRPHQTGLLVARKLLAVDDLRCTQWIQTPDVSSRNPEHLDDLCLVHPHKSCRTVVEVELDIVESGW